MAHVRKQIRDRVAADLTGLPVVGSNVYTMRKYALDQDRLPAILIYTSDEASSLITIGSRTLRRVINVTVELLVKGASDEVADDIDAVCVSIEEALAADYTLNGLAKSTILKTTEIDIDVQGEYSNGAARLVYSVEYITAIDDVETAR